MRYSIIGTGNTAWFLALRLQLAGHICTGIYGRNLENATALAKEVSADVYPMLEDIDDNADCCIIAVTDNAIKDIAAALSFKYTVLLHTAGAIGIDALEYAATDTAVLWPLYSITKHNLPAHREIPIIWEASTGKAEYIVKELADAISDIQHQSDSDQRKQLHLSAVFANNFANHLLTVADKLCTEQQMPSALLLPIIQQTFSRISQNNPYNTQTGPAKRGDSITMDKHIQLLNTHPDWQELYKAISASIANMYRDK